MKIYVQFEQQLFKHMLSEIRQNDGVTTPAALGESCAVFTRVWFGMANEPVGVSWSEGHELVAWSARLGKYVGEFFFILKEAE